MQHHHWIGRVFGVPGFVRVFCATALLCLGLHAAHAQSAPATPAALSPSPSPEKLFDPIASVLTHPRCINCHQAQAPKQKDTSITHLQKIVRGADGHGAPTMQCTACHQAKNSADGKVPGAPGWHLAPLSMSWEGKSRAQICQQIKDPARNGKRKTPHEVVEHMSVDPLVLWAWNPGGDRSTPYVSHEKFVEFLETWSKAGMPCPEEK